MTELIRQSEADATLRRLPVFVETLAGAPDTRSAAALIAAGFVVLFKKPGSAAVAVTGTLTADGLDGLFYVELTLAQTNVQGNGGYSWGDGGVSVISNTDTIKFTQFENTISAAVLAGFVRVAGLLRENSMLDNITYGSNNMIVIGRLRCFADATALGAAVAGHANGADGEIARYTVSAVDATGGQFSSWKFAQTLP